jgi:hypothetical protein
MVTHNSTGQPLEYASIVHPPDMLNLHPGSMDEKSVVRWTAPKAATVMIAGRFEGIDNFGTPTDGDGTTTDVAEVKNTNTAPPLFSDDINSYGDEVPFSITTTVAAGDTIDFVVGLGGNTYSNDSTGLSATISTLPQ